MQHFYATTQQLYQYISSLNKKVVALEKKINLLHQELNELKNKPSVNVERIEYKFDQLKVETLEGTLNIGLNPSDLNGIEDLAIPQSGKTLPKSFIPYREEIIQSLRHYIDHEVPTVIGDHEIQLQRTLDSSYYKAIQEDIKRQLPERVEFYMTTIPIQNGEDEKSLQKWKEKVISTLRKDIEGAIFTFMSKSPEEMKGANAHEHPSDQS